MKVCGMERMFHIPRTLPRRESRLRRTMPPSQMATQQRPPQCACQRSHENLRLIESAPPPTPERERHGDNGVNTKPRALGQRTIHDHLCERLGGRRVAVELHAHQGASHRACISETNLCAPVPTDLLLHSRPKLASAGTTETRRLHQPVAASTARWKEQILEGHAQCSTPLHRGWRSVLLRRPAQEISARAALRQETAGDSNAGADGACSSAPCRSRPRAHRGAPRSRAQVARWIREATGFLSAPR